MSLFFTGIRCQSSRLLYHDLEKEIWREIFTISDFRRLKERMRKIASATGENMSPSFADQKVNDIQYCIKQAFEYFSASKHSSVLIKPTLIYYGLISLSSAIIIWRKRDKALHTMREAHGLRDSYPEKLKSADINSFSRDDILQISAEIQESGTFYELLDMDISNYFTLPIKHPGKPDTSVNLCQKTNFLRDYPSLNKVDLLSIFQNIPELWKECRLSLQKDSYIFMGEAVLNKDTTTCRLSKEHISIKQLSENFHFINSAEGPRESNDFYFYTLTSKKYQQITPLVKTDIIGTQYLTGDSKNPLIISDFLLYYLAFFILGSLSRYKPALWRIMIEDKMKGLNTIPNVLCDSAYIKLPLHFLMELEGKFYKI